MYAAHADERGGGRSPPADVTYPDSEFAQRSVPVLARTLPSAGVARMRRRRVPSTAAIGRAARKDSASRCVAINVSNATVAFALVRLFRESPDPSSNFTSSAGS